MELVSTAKAQQATKELRNYKDFYSKIADAVTSVTSSPEYHPVEDFEGTMWIIFGSDLGLAGGYNSNIIKLAYPLIKPGDKVIVFGGRVKASLHSKLPEIDIESHHAY
jgi:F-type H+-transporting ATPase subunit gamma